MCVRGLCVTPLSPGPAQLPGPSPIRAAGPGLLMTVAKPTPLSEA